MSFNKKAVVFLSFLFLIQCSGLKVKDIKEGKYLQQAIEISVEDFFQKRMQNSIKKIIGHNWDILLETKDYVYIGYTKGSSYDDLYVEKLYKTLKNPLLEKFPSYSRYQGYQIKNVAYRAINNNLKHERTLIQTWDSKFYLKEDSIYGDIIWLYSVDGSPDVIEKYDVYLNKNDLSVIRVVKK